MAAILKFRVYRTRGGRWRWSLETTPAPGEKVVWARSGTSFFDETFAIANARIVVDRLRFEQPTIEVDDARRSE